MKSFIDLDRTFTGQPRELGGLLARIDTGRGMEQLYQDQRPELLQRLSQDARVASITASNAIEGIIVAPDRAERIAEGARSRNGSEREFAGYRDAVDELMRADEHEPLTIAFALHLHRQLRAHADGAGGNLKSSENLIASYVTGEREIVFSPPGPEETEFLLGELFDRYNQLKAEGRMHPLILTAAMVLDFLAIHPVADGNGRLARLLTTHELLSHGYGIARYVSIEQRIFESKHTYYDRLFESQRRWHEAEHDIWPWVRYLTQVVSDAYDAFEQRLAGAASQPAGKQERVRHYILDGASATFRRRDVERALPEVSLATIRLVLNELRDEGLIVSEGGGPSARWRRM